MRDPRINKWAEILVHYSIQVQKGQRVLIQGDLDALPLVEACYEECIKTGAKPELLLNSDRMSEFSLFHGTEDQLSSTPSLQQFAAENFERFLFIYAPKNTQAGSNVPLENHTFAAKGRIPISNAIMGRKAKGEIFWCRTHYPNPAAAQNASMGTAEFEEFVFKAGFLDHDDPIASWKKLGEEHEKMIAHLSTKKELHFKNKNGTNLLVNIEGMKWVNLCGTINFPDGEIYTGPNLNAPDGGVNGIVKYDFPTIYRGVEVDGIEITFEKGAVVDCKASRGEAFFKSMISQDPGAKYVGEIAIGTNYAISHGVKDILFDEKIGGTFHTALGKGYPETGNTNQSALHWDLVCDLRDNGEIFADGEKFLVSQFLDTTNQKRASSRLA